MDEAAPTLVRRWPITLTVLMGTVAVVLTTTIVNVAIPSIMADFDMGQIQAQWLSTGFLAAMTATMLTSARMVERYGQRRVFVGSLILFIAASLLAAASWNATVMIVARVMQGAIAGIMQPLALVIIFQVFPDRERGRALGLYGMGVVLAPAIGPTVGGVLLDVFGWRSVYLAALPFCVLGLWGAKVYLPDRRSSNPVPFDWWGLLFLITGLAFLLAGLAALTGDHDDLRMPLFLGGGAVAMLLFIIREWRARHAMVALAVFRYPVFTLTAILALIYGAGLFASTYLIPLLVQGVQEFSATQTGLVLMPAGLALAAIFPISGRMSDRWPAHWLILGGLSAFGVGLFGIAASGPATGFWILAGWIMLGRVGLGFMLPALNLSALRSLPESLMQQGSGMINFARQLGGAFGVNLFALLLEVRVAGHLAASNNNSFDLHRFYEVAGGDVPPAAAQALTQGFSDTFIVLGLLFVTAIIPAIAMGVRHARIRKNTARL